MNEPCARIENHQASVRILDHIGGVEIGIARCQEIGILGAESRAFAMHT